MKRVTLGGDRLGAGKKQQVDLHSFERSTHDLGYVWRNTQAPGTLVPFMNMLALPGDTFDIDLQADVKTHPTIGPLFASFKLQLDVFECPIRLYHAWLHNNKLKIGNDMSKVKLPQLDIEPNPLDFETSDIPLEQQQINQSSLLSYLGIRGIGQIEHDTYDIHKNAVPLLGYWDIYKNYYANKQEEIGMMVNALARQHLFGQLDTTTVTPAATVTSHTYDRYQTMLPNSYHLTVDYYGVEAPSQFYLYFSTPQQPLKVLEWVYPIGQVTQITGGFRLETDWLINDEIIFHGLDVQAAPSMTEVSNEIYISSFPLENIDKMREEILAWYDHTEPFVIDGYYSQFPYRDILKKLPVAQSTGQIGSFCSQQGLALKTYQSDIFNNWLNTEWIDGTGGINEISSVDTSSGSFNIDALNLAQKVYNMLNRIAVSGGSYEDWLTAVYDHESFRRAETPMYYGGLSKEIIFQEVVSTASVDLYENGTLVGGDPLGTLGGRGHLSGKHKGGKVTIKVNEPSFIIGIVSITPRIDYYQGNDFWTTHQTMNDLHKPNLDEIGFQDLVTDKMAFWDTTWEKVYDQNAIPTYKSAGKQPAWIDYMTNYNRLHGNFADERSEMFMTLARRFQADINQKTIKDLTTYIDPTKYNYAFAQTDLTSQNFWVQIGVDCVARRKMSAKVMPNL